MKMSLIGLCGVAIAGLAIAGAADRREQQAFGDAQVMIEFQRAADAYAFGHRQVDRRGAPPPARAEGTLFTPAVSDAFRKRIRTAIARQGCEPPRASDHAVPRVNTRLEGAPALPDCLAAALPPLPTELEYRVAGVALLLVDTHRRIVVDVLHGAFPAPAAP